MKKIIISILILILTTTTSCSFMQQQEPKITPNEGRKGGENISQEDDIEPDINYIAIKEDKELTDKMLENGGEMKDITLLEKEKLERIMGEDIIEKIEDIDIVETFVITIPEEVEVNLLYDKYEMPYSYLLITKENTKIYEKPALDAQILGSAEVYAKTSLLGKAKGEYVEESDSDEWYVLSWLEEGKTQIGYVTSDSGEPRKFQFEKMIDSITKLEQELKENDYGYISNYKDRNGSPPLINGKAVDKYGIQAYQSAPAYPDINDKDNFRYFPDGTIVFILDEQGGYFKVRNLEYEGEYWVPKRYISFEDNLDNLNKVVVVDTTNQNQGAFQRQGDGWSIVSYTLATTGVKAKYKFETPKGYFKVLEKKERFYYLDDVTKQVAGYAPYGTRFTAGAYIHGVPVAFQKKDGKNVDPGLIEYLFTIGTVPRSHKCVRNYTSHAKFIYNWADVNDTAVIVIG